MTPRHMWPGLTLILVLLAACQQGDSSGKGDKESDDDDTPAIPVETAYATRGDVYASYSGTAPVEAFSDATVIAKVNGEVREVLVEEGDQVTSGQILARLDGDRLRFEQMQTEANLRKLERDYERNVDLNKRGLISAGDFEKIKYEMEALRAQNDLAKLQLSYANIRAPIDGVISERFIKVGNTLEVEQPTFQVTSLEPLVSYLHVPEREYRQIGPGQPAAMIVDALGGAVFQGEVARISPVVDPMTGTFKITIEVSDHSRRLKPGMFARIAIVFDQHENVLQVPRSALVSETGSTTVFVIEDNVAYRRELTTGYAMDGKVEVVEGLTEEDQFVVVGQAGLKDGAKVMVIGDATTSVSAAKNEISE